MTESKGAHVLSLTPDQQRAVGFDGRRALLVAPAGSGKTEVLTRRLARILSESAGDSFRCLAVTYTVKAAQELRRRIRKSAAEEAWRVESDTLHGFALKWLQQYGEPVGIGPEVVVYADDADRVSLLTEFIGSLHLSQSLVQDSDRALRALLRHFDQHRTLHPGDPYPSDQSTIGGISDDELFSGYLATLEEVGGVDFPGMLVKFREALDVDPWIVNNFQSIFRHVLVDEAQDLTPAQTDLLVALTGDQVNLFAVADHRQSINGFAGGSFSNAERLVGAEAASTPLHLRHNFRASSHLLRAAGNLAQHLGAKSGSHPDVADAPPGNVVVASLADPADEAAHVVRWARRLMDEGLDPSWVALGEDRSIQPENIAIIGRGGWILEPVLARLSSEEVPHTVSMDPSDVLPSPQGRVLLELLVLNDSPTNRPALRRLHAALDEIGADTESTSAADIVSSHPSLEELGHVVAAASDPKALDRALRGLALAPTVESWAEDAQALSAFWSQYGVTKRAQERSVAGFMRYLAEVQRTRPSDPGIRVMTIHKAKGLEFKGVALVGAREGALPDFRATSDQDVEAERRALYVALTRASRSLLVTWPRTTWDRYGRPHQQRPSRFLEEAGLST